LFLIIRKKQNQPYGAGLHFTNLACRRNLIKLAPLCISKKLLTLRDQFN